MILKTYTKFNGEWDSLSLFIFDYSLLEIEIRTCFYAGVINYVILRQDKLARIKNNHFFVLICHREKQIKGV